MSDDNPNPGSSRRDLLTGKAIRHSLERRGQEIADELLESQEKSARGSGDTVRLSTKAMACEFSLILNPSENRRQVITATDALDIIHEVETQLTVYRETSDLLAINEAARQGGATVEEEIFKLIELSIQLAQQTHGAFTPTARALNLLWRTNRSLGKVPEAQEIETAVNASDYRDLLLDSENHLVTFQDELTGLDMSGIGKGYALDRVADFLQQEQVDNFLLHGGNSSILARGTHNTPLGWPVGIRHPQAPHKRIATILLQDQAFSASGSGVQFFRHEGKRYGHIFDPRTGWPVEHILNAVVVAPNAAIADALSTAFYVLPLEESIAYCEQHPEIAALIFPNPPAGKRLEPVSIHIDEKRLHWQ
ncbi:MAG TPA: hypothetical protein DD473_14940 [Planctomycetaceae bacterium]|nr:hypothetical protein [Planctomycetaceae bacterium]